MGSKRDTLKRRVRKTVKWGGAGLTVLLVVVWIGSGWWGSVVEYSSGSHASLESGRVFVYDHPPWNFRLGPEPPSWDLWFDWGAGRGGKYLMVPLWLPALLSLLATAAAWRADAKYLRRARAGLCASCGYDLSGLPAKGGCPECGKAIA